MTLRRHQREDETKCKRPPKEVLPRVASGRAANANDAEAEYKTRQHNEGAPGQIGAHRRKGSARHRSVSLSSAPAGELTYSTGRARSDVPHRR